ncbi:MAG: M20/M25/M40 family metallo-hydrolase, partial [Lachnospiraceae bacterium]|nr:M20/M25/M40 family metallo-hydrolase [Lachnospiraceae bacterium]
RLLWEQGIYSSPKEFEASCEAGMLQEAAGIPAVIWGPGEIKQAHQIDEYIELEQMYKGAELFIHFFASEDYHV